MRFDLLAACLIAQLLALPAIASDDDDGPASSAPFKPAPPNLLDLAEQNAALAGIQTQTLLAAQQGTELIAPGIVVNPEPLRYLRQQYLAARAQQDGAQAKYREADLNLARTQNLHREDIVSTRRLQEQQAQWQAEKANLAASGSQQQAVLETSRLQWGDTLTDWFVRSDSKAEAFIRQRAQLLLISLPAGIRTPPKLAEIVIDEQGRRDRAIKATLVSISPQADPVTQAPRYFYQCEGRPLPFGSQVTAWIAGDGEPKPGVVVPESAIVWHLGQAGVFVKNAEGRFNRRVLPDPQPVPNGYFVRGTLQAGEEIATTGAQTLLSQELKSSIPSEDND